MQKKVVIDKNKGDWQLSTPVAHAYLRIPKVALNEVEISSDNSYYDMQSAIVYN